MRKNNVNQRKHNRMILNMILSLPKTVYFNFKCFPWKTAIRLPILVSNSVKIFAVRRNTVVFDATPARFAVKIGFGGTKRIPARKGFISLEGGTLRFGGRAIFSEGISLSNAGEMYIGDQFFANTNCTFWCNERIFVGREGELGWNVLVRDGDGHAMFENGQKKPMTKPIEIGDHCWLCADSAVLKGGGMGDDCVLGFRSLLTKHYSVTHTLLAGTPAVPRRDNIGWER